MRRIPGEVAVRLRERVSSAPASFPPERTTKPACLVHWVQASGMGVHPKRFCTVDLSQTSGTLHSCSYGSPCFSCGAVAIVAVVRPSNGYTIVDAKTVTNTTPTSHRSQPITLLLTRAIGCSPILVITGVKTCGARHSHVLFSSYSLACFVGVDPRIS